MGKQPEVDQTEMQSLIRHVAEHPDGWYPLYDVWNWLTQGHWEAVGEVCADETCYLITSESSQLRTPVRPKSLQILEKTLHGYGQKCLALDVGVSSSTIASTAKQALASLGVACIPSRTPLALVLVAQASQDLGRTSLAPMFSFVKHGRRHFIIELSRPDRNLNSVLSPAEVAVLKARLEGQSHERIAHLRRTSTRTIANQIASASRRLGVTGRLETIGRLARQGLPFTALRS